MVVTKQLHLSCRPPRAHVILNIARGLLKSLQKYNLSSMTWHSEPTRTKAFYASSLMLVLGSGETLEIIILFPKLNLQSHVAMWIY